LVPFLNLMYRHRFLYFSSSVPVSYLFLDLSIIGSASLCKVFYFMKVKYDTVLRIRDILVRIRIQIRGSVPLTNRSGSATLRYYSMCSYTR